MYYKVIHKGRQIPKIEGEKLVQVLYIELDINNFKNNFNKIITVYRKKISDFKNRRKMYFQLYADLVKSNKAKDKLKKAYKRQKVFLEAIMQDYSSSLLQLDTILEGSSLPTLREMILAIKLVKIPNISLFHLVDRTWNQIYYHSEFAFLYMLHLADEAKLIIKNLLTYLQYQHRD